MALFFFFFQLRQWGKKTFQIDEDSLDEIDRPVFAAYHKAKETDTPVTGSRHRQQKRPKTNASVAANAHPAATVAASAPVAAEVSLTVAPGPSAAHTAMYASLGVDDEL